MKTNKFEMIRYFNLVKIIKEEVHVYLTIIHILILQTCKDTKDIGALQKAADFVKAFTLGFEIDVRIILSPLELISRLGTIDLNPTWVTTMISYTTPVLFDSRKQTNKAKINKFIFNKRFFFQSLRVD